VNNFGYYGKTPHRGDFVRYNLPRIFVSVWDDWMQQVLLQGEKTHESNWHERYLEGAGYWFTLSTGIAGDMSWGGIMIPSVDKVGRRFPFCLAAALPEGMPAVVAPGRLNSTFQALDQLATAIHSPELEFDQIQRQLEELADSVNPTSASAVDAPSPSNERNVEPKDAQVQIHVDECSPLDNPADASTLLDAVLIDAVFQYSVWIARDVDRAGMFLTSGLPIDRSGVALFDADWAGSGSRLLKRASIAPTNGLNPDDIGHNGAATDVPANTVPGTLTLPENPAETSWSAQHPDLPMSPVSNSASKEPEQAADNSDEMPADTASLSTGDWTEFASSIAREPTHDARDTPVPVPTIEPLEIEEDVDESEPWDP